MSKPSLLLVDDSFDAHALFRHALKHSRLSVELTSAYSTADAVRFLVAPRPYSGSKFRCLVVLDLQMPGLDGTAFLQTIRSVYNQEEIPIAVLTGSRFADRQGLKARYAINDFMEKPMESLELVAWINSLARFLPAPEKKD